MNVKKEQISESKVKLIIEVTAGELKPHVDKAYAAIAKNVKIQGFRPGKAPRNMVEKEVGAETIEKYVLEEAVPASYYEAIIKENVVPVGSPEVKVTKYVSTDGLTFEAEVSVMPEIKIPDLKKIKAKREAVVVEQSEIDESINYLREMFAERKESDRPAQEKDRVEIDFEGSIKGVPFEGGTSKNHPIVIGSKTFIPGFEEELVGMKKGDEKTFNITFPADYGSKELAGKEVQFKVKMNLLEETTLPELNDEFAGKVGPFKNMDELLADIKKKTAEGKESQAEKSLEDDILKKIADETKVELPESLVHEEVHRMTHEAEHNLSQSGLNLEQYLEHAKKSREDFEKELEGEARNRVKIGIILSEIVKEQKFDFTEKELTSEIDRIVEGVYPEKKDEARKYYEEGDGKRSIENSLLAKKAMEWIKDQVTINIP